MKTHPRRFHPRFLLPLALWLLAGLAMVWAPVQALARLEPARASPAPGPSAAIPLDRPLRFEHFSQAEGLSQDAVLAALQDHYGYLWFGTQDGLNRYDGYSFTVFKNDPDNSASLSHNGVIALLEDRQGGLWIGTWGGGLNRFDPASEHFRRYRHDPQDPTSLASDLVTALLEDSQGRLWVGTSAGLDLLDPLTGRFSHYTHDPQDAGSLSSEHISALLGDPSGALWVGTGGFGQPGAGLNRFDPATARAVPYRGSPGDPASLSSDNISALAWGADGRIWVATGGYQLPGAGLNRFDPQSGRAERFQHQAGDPASLSSDDLLSLKLDSSGVLWIATAGGGLERLDPASPAPRFVHTRHDPGVPSSLASDQVGALLEDRSGLFWVGTLQGGLNKLNPLVQRFRLLRNNPADPASLAQDAAGPILEDSQGRIWVGTRGGGLDQYHPESGSFSHFPGPSPAANTITALAEDRGGRLWVGSLDGLASFNPASGVSSALRHDPGNPASLVDNTVTVLREDHLGQLWVGTLGGLDLYDRQAGTFRHMQIAGLGPVVSALLDAQQMLWVGTQGSGLFRLDPSSVSGSAVQLLAHYQHVPNDPTSLGDNSVWWMDEDAQGQLWLATSGGLDHFIPIPSAFSHYREQDGLPNDSVRCILPGPDGRLWIATRNGLARFDPQAGTFRRYEASDGLQGGEFAAGSCLRARGGQLFFGGEQGISAFDPAQLQDNLTPPSLVISAFRIFNEPFRIDQNGGTPLNLSYRQNFISFEFAGLEFHAPQKNTYAYRLEGFDKDWVQAGTRRYASYTNLPGGDYIFRVKAANSDGVWSENALAIPLHITPPFYASPWFLGAAGLLALMSVAAAIRWRLDLVRDQKRRLDVLVGERTTSLRVTNQQLEVEVEQRKRIEEILARRAAEDLRQSEARFRAMFENAAVGIGLMSLDRRVLECNEAITRLFGYAPAEFVGMAIFDLLHPEDRAADEDTFLELVEGRRGSYQVEKRCLHKDGHYLWARLILSAVRGRDGVPLYLLGMFVDIDEQRRIEQELDQQQALSRQLLEQRVYERTLELRSTNERLQLEIEQRARAEQALSQKAAEEAVFSERNRLARELHDAVTQTLFSASLLAEVLPELFSLNPAEAARRLVELRQLTRGALAEMRTLLVELRPNALTDVPLPDLLRQLAEATTGRARLPVELRVEGQAVLPPDVQVALYRIVQEALHNVVKYARAGQAAVTLRLSAESVRLSIIDDGAGFDPGAIPAGHFGLRIMRERAESVGARLSIDSQPGEGTRIILVWAARPA